MHYIRGGKVDSYDVFHTSILCKDFFICVKWGSHGELWLGAHLLPGNGEPMETRAKTGNLIQETNFLLETKVIFQLESTA